MNTHDKIELPPLPRPQVPRIDADIDLMDIRRLVNWCEKTANEHARAAVEADRKRKAKQLAAYKSLVASLEAQCSHLRKMYEELKASTNPDLLASERAANAMLTEELEADRKRRGEPVAGCTMVPVEPTPQMIAAFRSGFQNELHKNDRRRTMSAEEAGLRAMLKASPQPAEPVKVPSDLSVTEQEDEEWKRLEKQQ